MLKIALITCGYTCTDVISVTAVLTLGSVALVASLAAAALFISKKNRRLSCE